MGAWVLHLRGNIVTALILDGKALAEKVRRQVAEEARTFTAQTGVVPGLTVVLVGEDPASQVYVRNKAAACKAAGMNGHVVRLPESTSQAELLAEVDRLNADAAVHGILVQLPLPRQIDESIVVERVDPRKDVDGFHPANFGLLAAGTPRFVPCTPLGIRELLLEGGIETRGAPCGGPGAIAHRGAAARIPAASESAGWRRGCHRLPHSHA